MSMKMTAAEREAFLADLHVGVLSIAREGRAPLSAPIWYDYEPGGEVWMITNASSLKGKALAGVTHVSLVAQTESLPYRYVSVEGAFTTRPSTDDEMLKMAVRYLGDEGGAQYAQSSPSDDDSIIVSFKPEKWLTVDYGKA